MSPVKIKLYYTVCTAQTSVLLIISSSLYLLLRNSHNVFICIPFLFSRNLKCKNMVIVNSMLQESFYSNFIRQIYYYTLSILSILLMFAFELLNEFSYHIIYSYNMCIRSLISTFMFILFTSYFIGNNIFFIHTKNNQLNPFA